MLAGEHRAIEYDRSVENIILRAESIEQGPTCALKSRLLELEYRVTSVGAKVEWGY